MGDTGRRWSDDGAARATQETIRAAADYIAAFRWQGYGILTFGYAPSPEGMQKAIARWFAAVQAHYPRSFLYVSADRGRATDHWNVHVLIGGLFDGTPPAEPHRTLAIRHALDVVRRLWRHGRVETAAPYDPRGGAAAYLAQYWNDQELPATLLGDPIRKSHRNRIRDDDARD